MNEIEEAVPDHPWADLPESVLDLFRRIAEEQLGKELPPTEELFAATEVSFELLDEEDRRR